MAQQNRTTLKGYFNTGDTPTEAQFADLIDSFHNPSNDGAVQVQPSEGAFANGDKTKLDGIATGATANSDESIQDLVGAMLTGNTETRITVTYQDADGTIDFVVDNDLSNYDNTTSGFAVAATLASASVGDGAALVGYDNADSGLSATTVKAALDELDTDINDLGSMALEDTSSYTTSTNLPVNYYDAGDDKTAARPSVPTATRVLWANTEGLPPDNLGVNDTWDGYYAGSLLISDKTAAYSFVDADRGTIVRATSGTLTFTIDPNATTAWTAATGIPVSVGVVNDSGNNLTIQGGTGVSVNGASAGSVTVPDGGTGLLIRNSSDDWSYYGDAS